jgi:hypothetical protein
MSTYSVDELLRQWQRNSITPEQAIGSMLQHLVLLSQRDGQRGERVADLAASVHELANRLADQTAQSDQSDPERSPSKLCPQRHTANAGAGNSANPWLGSTMCRCISHPSMQRSGTTLAPLPPA